MKIVELIRIWFRNYYGLGG